MSKMNNVVKVLAVLALLVGCSNSQSCNRDRRAEVLALAAAQHQCKDTSFLEYHDETASSYYRWARVNVCGTVRFYEYGQWCEDCTYTWRERAKQP